MWPKVFILLGLSTQKWNCYVIKWKWSSSVVCDSLRPYGLQPTRLLHPWDFPGKSTEVGCHCLLQGIFLTQRSNSDLLHYRKTLYHLSQKRSQSRYMNKFTKPLSNSSTWLYSMPFFIPSINVWGYPFLHVISNTWYVQSIQL